MHAHSTTRYWSHFRHHDLSAHGMYYLDFGHSVVSTSHSVSATGVQRDHNYDPPEKYVQDSIHV